MFACLLASSSAASIDESCPTCYDCFDLSGVTLRGQGEYDRFGQSVAVSNDGNRVVAIGSAFVSVFGMIENKWTKVMSDLDLGSEYDSVSGSIAISSDGTRVAVGVMLYDNNVENSTKVSFVRVFDLTENQWTQVGLDLEGGSIALSSDGNRIAIGGQQSDDLGDILVRIFDWTGSQWTQVGSNLYDNLDEGNSTSRFATLGGSIALSSDGNRVAVGSFQTPFGEQGSPRGQVRVYDWTGSQWTQVGGDLGTNLPDVGNNPWEVDLSSDGNRIIISAPPNSVSIYDWMVDTQDWTPVVLSIQYAFELDSVASVAISSDGNRVAVGAAVDLLVVNFEWTGSQWKRMEPDLYGDGLAGLQGEMFGSSVALALDGDRVVVGAPWDFNVSESGSIKIFDLADLPCA